MGGERPSESSPALREFWDEIDLFLPPKGRLLLAHTADGALVGCGSLKTLTREKGELKRLFVKPETRGTGLGRRLVEMRLDAAREMGLKALYVDTLSANVEMRGLYKKLGFDEIEFYPESATYRMLPELLPLMAFYTIDL